MSPIKCITLEEELQKNSELKMSDIQILREWCEKQPHLPKIPDMQIALILHSNYYKIEQTKNTIENYYTIRTHVPEFFFDRDPLGNKELRASFKVFAHCFVKGKTKEGYDIIIGQFTDFEPSHYVYNDITKGAFMVHDMSLWTKGTTPGYIFILDTTGFSLGHLARTSLIILKKFLYYLQDGFPVRLKGVHIINISPVVETMYNMIKPFIMAELQELIHFHSSMESTAKYFPIDALPNEFGGKAGPVKELVDKQVKELENFREWFLEYDSVSRVDESLRIGKSKINDMFGVDGTFKKLDID